MALSLKPTLSTIPLLNMQLSQIPEYRLYGEHLCAGDANKAEECLLKCLAALSEPRQESFIYYLLGSLYQLNRDKEKSLRYFTLAEEAAPNSLQPLLFQAQFMASEPELKAYAIHNAKHIIEHVKAGTKIDKDATLTPTYYAEAAQEILDALDK